MKKNVLPIATAMSVVMLIAFGVLQHQKAAFLDLPMQWLFIACFPTLVALFVGGHITRFKGFGVELESQLNKTPIASLDLTAKDAVADIPGDEKQSIGYLGQMSDEEADATRWLRFESGRTNYYTAHGIEQYLQRLRGLEFMEVLSGNGNFIAYLPIEELQTVEHGRARPSYEALQRFVEALEQDRVPEAFARKAITTQVQNGEGLISVLQKLRAQRVELAAVVSDDGRYMGAIRSSDIERRIADSVLVASAANS